MDILAALPTPPHNQNEDIRYNMKPILCESEYIYLIMLSGYNLLCHRMESDDEDAPESIIPASSPESNVGDETPRFPRLWEPKEEETERAISPIIPLIPRTAIPGTNLTTSCLIEIVAISIISQIDQRILEKHFKYWRYQ